VWQAYDAALAELEAEGARVVEPEGVDARDVVASLARWWTKRGGDDESLGGDSRLRILSGRLELAALADDSTGIDIAREDHGASVVEGEAASRARLPVAPELLADYLALASLEGIGAKPREQTRGRAALPPMAKVILDAAGSAEWACRDADLVRGLKEPQRRALREAAGEPIQKAVAMYRLKTDVPVEWVTERGAEHGEGKEAKGERGQEGREEGATSRVGRQEQVREEAQGRREHGSQRHVGPGAGREAESGGGVTHATPPSTPAEPGGQVPGIDRVARAVGSAPGLAVHAHAEAATKASPRAKSSEKEREKMSQQAQQNQQRQRPQQQKDEALSPKAARAQRIRSIFDFKRKELATLFPKDGDTLVSRAQATALAGAAGFDVDVTADSIAETAIACHHLGLEIGDQAYMVPYKEKGISKAKLIVGPRGLIALAYRSGFVKSIVARSVFDGDEFTYNLGTDEITHRKAIRGRREWVDDNGVVIRPTTEQAISHAYVRIETTTDGKVLEVLTWEDIAYYRSFSKANSGPWFDNYEGMCRKTAIKRGLEFVPRSPLMSAALRETSEGHYQMDADTQATIDELLKGYRARQEATAPVDDEPAAQTSGATAAA
jgi:recombination protein RecT